MTTKKTAKPATKKPAKKTTKKAAAKKTAAKKAPGKKPPEGMPPDNGIDNEQPPMLAMADASDPGTAKDLQTG